MSAETEHWLKDPMDPRNQTPLKNHVFLPASTERDRDARVQGLLDPPFDHERRGDLCHTCSHALCETVLWAECYGKREADR